MNNLLLPESLLIVCLFTFIMHGTEALAYSIRYAGLKTKQIAIAMSFVSSTLLISRLSNMLQAPLVGKMVDTTIKIGTSEALTLLETNFRIIILSASAGVIIAAFLTPTFIKIYVLAITHFLKIGSLPKMFLNTITSWKRLKKIITCFTLPRLSMLKGISWKTLPKRFLFLNGIVTSIYAIGVLASLLAGAFLPDLRATAIQLSGIVNGIATILFTLMVDPPGARITDQAVHGNRPSSDVKSVVFFLILFKLTGVLIISQLILIPATRYIMFITRLI